jgi:hypothetical protein
MGFVNDGTVTGAEGILALSAPWQKKASANTPIHFLIIIVLAKNSEIKKLLSYQETYFCSSAA